MNGYKTAVQLVLKKIQAVNSPYKILVPRTLVKMVLSYFHDKSLT